MSYRVESTLCVLPKDKQGSRQYSRHWDIIRKVVDAYGSMSALP